MRLFLKVLRISVIVLLTIRVFAAPLGMRPDSSRMPKNFRLKARFCSWPAQNQQRSISATSLYPRFAGEGPGGGEDWGHRFGRQERICSTRELLIRFASVAAPGQSPSQFSLHLRC
jgi:hypothetical protein